MSGASRAAGYQKNRECALLKNINLEIPEKYLPLYQEDYVYAMYYGGRASAKSYSIVNYLIFEAMQRPINILCTRHIQRSIRDSVKALIDARIRFYGLDNGRPFFIRQNEISSRHGSKFLFQGLYRNFDSIRSMYDISITFIEEAQAIDAEAWSVLHPTVIRVTKPKIIIALNPDSKDDILAKEFIEAEKEGTLRKRTICKRVTYQDNPYLNEITKDEIEHDKQVDYQKYLHIWGGEYRKITETLVFRDVEKGNLDDLLDENSIPYQGCDWGASAPTCLMRFFYLRGWNRKDIIYIRKEAYRENSSLDELPALFAGNCPTDEDDDFRWRNPWNDPGIDDDLEFTQDVRSIVTRADSSWPHNIGYMRDRKFNFIGVKKGKGSKYSGISFLKGCKIVIHPECSNAYREFNEFSWKVDPHTNEILDEVEERNNHTIDAVRYGAEELIARHRKRRSTISGPRID